MIKIMVDTGSDCRKAKHVYDYIVPLSVTIGENTYLDGVDLEVDQFYDLLTGSEDFPKTAQPSPQAFADIFDQVKADGDELIYFSISSQISGTYQSANVAKDMVEYDKIYIVDTLSATHCIRYLAEYAKKCIAEGLSAEEIVERCEELKKHVKVIVGLDTLEFLYKGGRLSKTSATVGGLVGIKPIVTLVEEGKVESIGKALRRNKAMDFIVKQMETMGVDESFPVYSIFSYGEDNCVRFEDTLAKNGIAVQDRLQLGATIGTHTGPGVFGTVFLSK